MFHLRFIAYSQEEKCCATLGRVERALHIPQSNDTGSLSLAKDNILRKTLKKQQNTKIESFECAGTFLNIIEKFYRS